LTHVDDSSKVAADGVLNFIFASIVSEKDARGPECKTKTPAEFRILSRIVIVIIIIIIIIIIINININIIIHIINIIIDIINIIIDIINIMYYEHHIIHLSRPISPPTTFHYFPETETRPSRKFAAKTTQVILQTRFHLIMADPCMTEVAIRNPKQLGFFWISERQVVEVVFSKGKLVEAMEGE